MLNTRFARDTASLSNRINLKLNSTDTSVMLSNRINRDTISLSNRINLKLSSVILTTNVTGILPIVNGGTNSNVTPTAGAIDYGTGSAHAFTAAGTSGQYLQSAGVGTPIWAQPGPASVQVLTVLTVGTTYTTPTGVKAIMIELVGGGGGSAAIPVSTGSGGANVVVSGGGGSGSYTRVLILNPNASYNYSIGIGGGAGPSASPGGNGSASSFNSTITAPGGTGGASGSTAAIGAKSLGGAGGVLGANGGIVGSFMTKGNAGGTGFGVTRSISFGGNGANSIFGGGPIAPAVTTSSLAGIAATGYGAGASGAAGLNGALNVGAAGAPGVIIITEYK
jgi:hypothetical protein